MTALYFHRCKEENRLGRQLAKPCQKLDSNHALSAQHPVGEQCLFRVHATERGSVRAHAADSALGQVLSRTPGTAGSLGFWNDQCDCTGAFAWPRAASARALTCSISVETSRQVVRTERFIR